MDDWKADMVKKCPHGDQIVTYSEEVMRLLLEKNAAYKDSAFQETIFGTPPEVAVRTRIGDKVNRLKFMLENGETNITEDTIMDLAGYFIIYGILMREKENNG